MKSQPEREIVFVGSSEEDLGKFPLPVKRVMGYALRMAQWGQKHPEAKPMAGFQGARILEIRDDHDGDTYRTVYTVTLGDVVYVLHAFQKKSTHGIKTPKQHLETIRQRLVRAKDLYAERERGRQDQEGKK